MDLDCETAVDANVIIRDRKDAGSFLALLSPPLSSAKASHRKTGDLEFDKANVLVLRAVFPAIIFSQLNQPTLPVLCT